MSTRQNRAVRWRTIVATFSVDISRGEGKKTRVARNRPPVSSRVRPIVVGLYCPPRSEWRGAEYLPLRRSDPLVPAERSLALLAHSHGPDIAALMRAGAHARTHAISLVRACQVGFRSSERMRTNANEQLVSTSTYDTVQANCSFVFVRVRLFRLHVC